MTTSEWTLLREYGSMAEASLDLGVLETEEVPTLVRGNESGIFGPGFAGSVPFGVRVYVPTTAIELARELVGEEPAEPEPY